MARVNVLTVAADGATSAPATQPGILTNMTTGLIDAVTANGDRAYSGNGLRSVAASAAIVGVFAGNWLANRAWKAANGGEPRRILGMLTA